MLESSMIVCSVEILSMLVLCSVISVVGKLSKKLFAAELNSERN